MNKKFVIVVGGEPYSVFSEIFFKALKKKKINSRILLICSKKIFLSQMRTLKYSYKINILDPNNKEFLKKFDKTKINILNVDFNKKKVFDSISKNSSKYLDESFNLALKLINDGISNKIINGPISKKHFLQDRFPGITEYLAHKSKTKNYAMLIYNNKLSVCPITTHIPLKDVHKKISKKKIIDKIQLIVNFYKKELKKNPIIAITGLNPHCESNFNNSEEKNIIIPSIKFLKKRGINVSGPFAADTIFLKNNYKKFDVIVGMYHDQVLTPIKSIFGFKAINMTLGLPFKRLSPDHGPNEKMQGKNISNPDSLIESFNFFLKND